MRGGEINGEGAWRKIEGGRKYEMRMMTQKENKGNRHDRERESERERFQQIRTKHQLLPC